MQYTDLACNLCGESGRIVPNGQGAQCQACGGQGIVEEHNVGGSQTIAGVTTVSDDIELRVLLEIPPDGRRIFRNMGVGDIVFTTPLIQVLKERGEVVTFVGTAIIWPLVSELVDNCIPHGNVRPDDIDLNGFLDGAAEWGAPSRPAFYATQAGIKLDWPVCRIKLTPEAEEYRRQFCSEAARRITLAPYSSTGDRSLPSLEKLEFEGYTVSVCHSGVKPPYGDMHQMMGLLAASDLVIAVDSGPLYVASALGVPVLGFYTRVWPPRLWYQDNWTAAWVNHEKVRPLDLDWIAEQALKRLNGDAMVAEGWSLRTDSPELRFWRN